MAVEVTKGATTGTPREGSTEQWVYMAEDAPATNRDLLGGKGAGLAAMTQAGLPVPPAFTITTAACNAYVRAGNQFPPGLWDQTLAALKRLEEKSGRKLGDAANPLLVSVRSGARESMRLRLDREDASDDMLFNRILWLAMKGDAPYPGARRASTLEVLR